MRSYEYVLSESPFTVRRKVRWADCDPAGVVYTGQFSEYVLSAVALFKDFIADAAGGGARSLDELYGVGMPCRGMAFDFSGTLWPGDCVDIECWVGEIRTKSFDFHFQGHSPDSRPIFTARFSPICVRTDARIGTEIPPALRATLQRHARQSIKNSEYK